MTRVAGARWTALVAVGALASGLAGCGGGSGGTDVKRVAIATPGASSEIGWSQQGATALHRVARQLHVQAKVAEGLGEGDVAPALRRLSSGAQLVIAHGRGYAAAAAKVAADTGVPELVFGSPERLKPDRVGDVEVATEEGGYIAGYISARASWVRSVGIVLAGDDPAWYRTAGGFVAGARAFDPHVIVRYTHIPGRASQDDVASSLHAAEAMIARGDRPIAGGLAIPFHRGAQMVLGLGDKSTLGVMRATMRAQQGIGRPKFDSMFVDVVGDKAGSGHISITGLTAVVWNFAPAYQRAIRDLRAGAFGKRVYKLDLANGGVRVIANGRTPSDNYRAALQLARKVEQGKVHVPVVTDEAQLQALLTKPS